MKNSIIPIFIPHLGCPHDCVFCNQRAIAAPKVPGFDEVRGEITAALKYAKNPQIAFYGGSFTAIESELMIGYLTVAQEFLKSGQASGIRVSTRPDCIDSGVLAILSTFGVDTIELGAQSMEESVLALSGRGHSPQDTVAASGMIQAAGFELGLQVMCGLPGGSRAEAAFTAGQTAALKPNFVRIYPVCVIADTALERMAKNGSYTPISVEQATEMAADMLEIFESAGIPVIRIGLNPTEELSAGGAVGGAYHPAMGELVRSRVLLRKLLRLLKENHQASVTISVPKGNLSLLRGQKNCNVKALTAAYPNRKFIFTEALEQAAEISILTQ